ncbi:hypothetical protein FH508_0008775 [Lysinibacillus sp. CD3-6]|uniref:hypothetical protein n=1 Tax=Lysinibacillus sp. CD3-6 TaxID=2892541 RepID=UPI00111D0F15|nr:hypothetical protein [Lysinibacillus sp. CD3-6]UED81973.1 hypothetical protein FH508_0008775 [Lysinibacillus sp. CD3-6]
MTFIDKWVEEADRKLMTNIKESVSETVNSALSTSWDWFVGVLPDLTGYATLAAGAAVILSTAAGQGMIKPLGIYSCVLITSLCILVGV